VLPVGSPALAQRLEQAPVLWRERATVLSSREPPVQAPELAWAQEQALLVP